MTSAKPDPGGPTIEAGSEAHTQDIIAAQDLVRAQERADSIRYWAPWAGAAAVVVGAYLLLRQR